MRHFIKNLVISTVPPVQRLQQDRDNLRKDVADLTNQLSAARAAQSELARAQAEIQELQAEILDKDAKIDGRSSFVPPHPMSFDFDADGMKLWDKNLKSLADPRFVEAYNRSSDPAVPIQFRAYVCCWAAAQAAKFEGDFVECGVNEGWLSLTICNFLSLNTTGKFFYLFDTFNGIPKEQIADSEAARAALHHYPDCFELAKRNFAPFPKAKLVRGKIPDTLSDVLIEKVSYLSIDMNIEKPERDAIEFFWPKLVSGGIVVLDDYAFGGYEKQHDSMDEFANRVGANILTLPTGQGIIIKI